MVGKREFREEDVNRDEEGKFAPKGEARAGRIVSEKDKGDLNTPRSDEKKRTELEAKYNSDNSERDGGAKKLAISDPDSRAVYERIKSGKLYSVEELQDLPAFNKMQQVAEETRLSEAKRLNMSPELDGYTYRLKTPEREQAREKWVNEFLSGSGRAETRPPNGAPLQKGYKMTVVVGLPASGKSSQIANPISNDQGAFIFDSDEMKKLIDGFADGKNADGVHVESKDLLKRAQAAFTSGSMKGTNLVYPIIGDDAGKTMKKLQPFIDAGYSVEIAYKHADTQKSMNRVVARAIETGRIIPKDTVMEYNNDNIVGAYKELVKQGIKRSKYGDKID